MTIFNPGSLITAAQLQLLEQNFSSAAAPAGPVTGQLWYDSSVSTLKIFNGSNWIFVSGVVILGSSPPATPVVGALWYNTTTNKLLLWNGATWLPTAPDAAITYSQTPPSSPSPGNLWYNATDTVGRLFVWSGTVWIDTNPSGSSVGGQGLGVRQTWQNMTGSRSSGVTYTNSTGKPISVMISFSDSYPGMFVYYVYVNGVTLAATGSDFGGTTNFIVPDGGTYSISVSNIDIGIWSELR